MTTQAVRDAVEPDVLVTTHLWLARRVARRYAERGIALDDLEQVAAVGLVLAASRFDPGRGTPFAPYAEKTMAGEVRRHFRDHGWLVRPPRPVQELALALLRLRPELTHDHHREPSVQDLARASGADPGAVARALAALDAYSGLSLDVEPDDDGPRTATEALTLVDDTATGAVEHAVLRVDLETALRTLDPREREIVRLRYHEDLSQREIAAAIGVSQVHVSRLLRGIHDRLRAHLSAGGDDDLPQKPALRSRRPAVGGCAPGCVAAP